MGRGSGVLFGVPSSSRGASGAVSDDSRLAQAGRVSSVHVESSERGGYTEEDFFGVTMCWSNYGLGGGNGGDGG